MKIDNTNIKIDGSNLKIIIILPYFNESMGNELLKNTKDELLENNVKEESIKIVRVAGALEIPYAAKKIINRDKPDAVIALGIVIRGETTHYDLVTEESHRGIMKVQLDTETPISFGILGCENIAQAKERIDKNKLNKGKDAALAALIQTTKWKYKK